MFAIGRAACIFLLASASIAVADDAEIHTFHCLHGCPMGSPATNDLIVREIYTLSSNDRTKFADWVAYRVTAVSVGPSEGRRWQTDPWLAEDETLEPDDYENAREVLETDRGHQAPLAALSGTPFAEDTNILSNITPQRADLNQASWQYLEGRERELATRAEDPLVLYVLTGPLYERVFQSLPMPQGAERHRVPSGYWKVIATEDGRMSAFIFDQETPRNANYCDLRVSLEEVELRTNLTIFPRLEERAFLPLDEDLECAAPEPVA